MVILSSCAAPVAAKNQPLAVQNYAGITRLEIQVEKGQIDITSSDSPQLTLSGDAPADLEVHQESGTLRITSEKGAVHLQLAVPPGVAVEVISFYADLQVTDLAGQLRVDSQAGDITVTGFSGEGSLRSGRGDILVAESGGQLTLLGEHGLLQLVDSFGDLSATTIMGTVLYSGRPGAGDHIWLETDHGPVQMKLRPGSSLMLESSTSGGKISCLATALFENQACSGPAGAAEAAAAIRTVSGNITISAIP